MLQLYLLNSVIEDRYIYPTSAEAIFQAVQLSTARIKNTVLCTCTFIFMPKLHYRAFPPYSRPDETIPIPILQVGYC